MCLLCGEHGRPQKIWIAGMLVVRMLCDPCKEWVAPKVQAYPTPTN